MLPVLRHGGDRFRLVGGEFSTKGLPSLGIPYAEPEHAGPVGRDIHRILPCREVGNVLRSHPRESLIHGRPGVTPIHTPIHARPHTPANHPPRVAITAVTANEES